MCDFLETTINGIDCSEIYNNPELNSIAIDIMINKTEFEKLQELIKTLNTNLCILYNNDRERINELYNRYILRI